MSSSDKSVMLEVKGLSKSFGSVKAVKDLNFQVAKGDVFGFLGPNGAGKTTTMRIVTCFIPATEGSVKVGGMDTVENSLAVRRTIGYLPESAPLYNDMSVDEYLRFAGEIRGLSGASLQKRIDEMYEVCGLKQMRQRQIGNLSKGYRQRVGLAQALMHDPDLLILDEPMSGLDPNQIVEIRKLIKRIGEEKTVIYCSHILPEVSATCNEIMIINDGSIVASGTPDELMSRGGGNRYALRAKGPRETLEQALTAISGVASVAHRQSDNDWHEFEVFSEHEQTLGEELFKCIAGGGWSLSELRQETASLEDVFTQLTRG